MDGLILNTWVFTALLITGWVYAQDALDIDCDPSINHRFDKCPKGYCCVRDEFLLTYVYCRRIGEVDDNCNTKQYDETECPCGTGLYCRPNIMGSFPSVYGRCVVNDTTTPSTTPTTTTPTQISSTTTPATASMPTTTLETASTTTAGSPVSSVSSSLSSPSSSSISSTLKAGSDMPSIQSSLSSAPPSQSTATATSAREMTDTKRPGASKSPPLSTSTTLPVVPTTPPLPDQATQKLDKNATVPIIG